MPRAPHRNSPDRSARQPDFRSDEPDAMRAMARDQVPELMKLAVESLGKEATVVRLEEAMVPHLFPDEGWKKFFEGFEFAKTVYDNEGSIPSAASLQNGNFTQPQIANNSYQYISSNSTVPGWNFYAVLINNSAAWGYPMPYPSGSQAACIQATQVFGQYIQLSSGTYTLTFYACGRPGYLGANTINVYCVPAGQNANSVYTFTPPTNTWQKYTTTINIQNSGNYALGFNGISTTGDKSAAIQGIQINISGGGSSGSYTYDQCKELAIDSGYQYFA